MSQVKCPNLVLQTTVISEDLVAVTVTSIVLCVNELGTTGQEVPSSFAVFKLKDEVKHLSQTLSCKSLFK